MKILKNYKYNAESIVFPLSKKLIVSLVVFLSVMGLGHCSGGVGGGAFDLALGKGHGFRTITINAGLLVDGLTVYSAPRDDFSKERFVGRCGMLGKGGDPFRYEFERDEYLQSVIVWAADGSGCSEVGPGTYINGIQLVTNKVAHAAIGRQRGVQTIFRAGEGEEIHRLIGRAGFVLDFFNVAKRPIILPDGK